MKRDEIRSFESSGSPNWYTAPIPNQSLDLGPSSQFTTPNSLGDLIFFEGFKNVNLISQINDYPFLD